MRVAVYPADEGGCGHYRLIWPATALRDQGHDVDLRLGSESKGQIRALYQHTEEGPRVMALGTPIDADVVVLQRPLDRDLVDLIPHIQKSGSVVVVEIDDDFRSLSARNIAWKAAHPRTDPNKNWLHLDRACELADWVTCSTPALANRYGKHGRVSVIPNYVPERYLKEERIPKDCGDDNVYVGWTGSVNTHPDDLQVMGDGLRRAMRKDPRIKFAVVGSGLGVNKKAGLPLSYPLQVTGWLPIDRFTTAMAQFDVGLVPLEPSPFNNAKSWLKGLEFAALGVPFIASPVEQYRALADMGIGTLAENPHDWRHRILGLLHSGSAAEQGALFRERVDKQDLLIERRAVEWWYAWIQAHMSRLAA